MFTEDEMRKLGLNECVDMIGRDLVMAHKDLCLDMWTWKNGMFHYGLGMSLEEREYPPHAILMSNTPMDFYAWTIIDPESGRVVRNYEDSTLPN